MCRRRAGDPETFLRSLSYPTLVEMLRRDSGVLLCFVNEFLFIRLLVEKLRLSPIAGLEALPNSPCSGEGVNGGPGAGTGTRRNASWEFISRTMASWSDSYVGRDP